MLISFRIGFLFVTYENKFLPALGSHVYHPPASLKLKRADICVGPIQADLGPDREILSLRKGSQGEAVMIVL